MKIYIQAMFPESIAELFNQSKLYHGCCEGGFVQRGNDYFHNAGGFLYCNYANLLTDYYETMTAESEPFSFSVVYRARAR